MKFSGFAPGFYSDSEIFLPNRSSSPGPVKNHDKKNYVHIPSYVVVTRNIRERPDTA